MLAKKVVTKKGNSEAKTNQVPKKWETITKTVVAKRKDNPKDPQRNSFAILHKLFGYFDEGDSILKDNSSDLQDQQRSKDGGKESGGAYGEKFKAITKNKRVPPNEAEILKSNKGKTVANYKNSQKCCYYETRSLS